MHSRANDHHHHHGDKGVNNSTSNDALDSKALYPRTSLHSLLNYVLRRMQVVWNCVKQVFRGEIPRKLECQYSLTWSDCYFTKLSSWHKTRQDKQNIFQEFTFKPLEIPYTMLTTQQQYHEASFTDNLAEAHEAIN